MCKITIEKVLSQVSPFLLVHLRFFKIFYKNDSEAIKTYSFNSNRFELIDEKYLKQPVQGSTFMLSRKTISLC
jgi:hypothetical protein